MIAADFSANGPPGISGTRCGMVPRQSNRDGPTAYTAATTQTLKRGSFFGVH
jgi:hypothetical protein